MEMMKNIFKDSCGVLYILGIMVDLGIVIKSCEAYLTQFFWVFITEKINRWNKSALFVLSIVVFLRNSLLSFNC